MKIRSFIAINLPKKIKDEIKKIIDILGRSGNGVKWVEPENLHLTLHFLGWLEEEKIEDVKKILSEATKGLEPCFMKIEVLDCFPTKTSPRVIFLECLEESNLVKNLREKIGERLEKIGIEIDERPFRLHLTLGRVKSGGFRLPQITIRQDLSFEVSGIDLMRSELTREGPIYTVTQSFPFINF